MQPAPTLGASTDGRDGRDGPDGPDGRAKGGPGGAAPDRHEGTPHLGVALSTVPASTDDAAALYEHAQLLRLVGSRMVAMERTGKVAGHARCFGDEGTIAAAVFATAPADWVFPGLTEWGAALIRGLPLSAYAHHALGTSKDPAKGHSPPDHPPASRFGVAPASGVLAAHLPQAVGAAWAAKMRGDAVAVLALFDERADATGDLHNALNFAGVFRVPCVFLCRRFPESPSRASASHATVGADSLALSYGIASASVDGTDALAVLTVVRAALARARAGRGAVFIEAVMAEPPTPDEIEKVVADSACEPTGSAHPSALPLLGAFDPLRRLRAVLEAASRFDLGADAASLDAQLMAIDRAFLDAEGAGDPDTASLFDDVYAEVPGHLRAQKESATWRK